MGWGISIDQDENGFVSCGDADFETGPEDYEGYPPCSYDMIYEGVESQRREIDMARDEIGLEAARAQAWEAFGSAKGRWDNLHEDAKLNIHNEYAKDLKKQIRECKVDRKREKDKRDQITFFEKRFGQELDKLGKDIAELEAKLEERRAAYKKVREPLEILEGELAVITAPTRWKKELQKRLELEDEAWDA